MVWDELEEALEKPTTPSPAASAARSRAASPSTSRASAPSCRARWSTCVRCTTRSTSKARNSSSRSSSSTASATTWWSRAARWSRASMREEREKLLETLQEGAVVKGVVKNITDYGAFVDLGGIDGLLHITDMAWRRVRHPSEVVEVGQELDVRVLKFDREHNRVSLGLKQLGEDPWDGIARRYPPTPACSARSPTSPITARSSRSSRASKAWCTCPKWTGPTRTSTRPRSCRSATRSKSWCSRSTKSAAASRSA